jgi:hypothetical protein
VPPLQTDDGSWVLTTSPRLTPWPLPAAAACARRYGRTESHWHAAPARRAVQTPTAPKNARCNLSSERLLERANRQRVLRRHPPCWLGGAACVRHTVWCAGRRGHHAALRGVSHCRGRPVVAFLPPQSFGASLQSPSAGHGEDSRTLSADALFLFFGIKKYPSWMGAVTVGSTDSKSDLF